MILFYIFNLNRFESKKSLGIHGRYKNRNECKICSQRFCTASDLNKHRQQGCEDSIEIGSTIMDCKSIVADSNLEVNHTDENEDGNQTIDNDPNDDEPSFDANQQEEYFDNENSTDSSVSVHIENKPPLKKQNQPKKTVGGRAKDLPFKCDVCGQGFTLKSNLNVHSKMHSGAQIPCNYCDRIFWLVSKRNEHERIKHLNIRNFECNECGKCFPYKSHLDIHLQGHARRAKDIKIGVRFECWLCHKE